jgi:hypothetical protein
MSSPVDPGITVVNASNKQLRAELDYRNARDDKLSAAREHARELLEAWREGMVCGFQFCAGPEAEPEIMVTCRACWALHDLLELTR